MAKPATQRPKLPGVGRLGLVELTARADLDRLGWTTDERARQLAAYQALVADSRRFRAPDAP